MSETFTAFGKSFQEKVLQSMFMDPRWAEQTMEVMKPEYFDLKYLQFLADKYYKFAQKYKTFPSMQMLVTIIKDDLKQGSDKLLVEQIVEYLQRIKANPDAGDLAYVKDKALDFCRKQALKEAMELAIDKMEEEKYEQIAEIIKKAVMVGTTPSLGHEFFKDYEARFTKLARGAVATGFAELDAKDIFDGGLGAGEIGIVIASTGVGKCSHKGVNIKIKYVMLNINGKSYKPWDRINTLRGEIFARDVVETDEII